MAVQNDTSRIQYNGNNSTVNAYAIPFPFFENGHIRCVVTSSAGVDTELTLGSGFTLTGAGNPSGGSLLTIAAVPAASKVTIFRNVPATQTTSYQEGGDFPAASHERALDKLTMIAQQTQRLADRALKVPETQNNPNDLPNSTTGQKLLGSNNGVITWEDNRQLPAYPGGSGQKFLTAPGSGSPPSWQDAPSIAVGPITATNTITPRFIADRAAEVINILDFGADPTGTQDSWLAIQRAILRASNHPFWDVEAPTLTLPPNPDSTLSPGDPDTFTWGTKTFPKLFFVGGARKVLMPKGNYLISRPIVVGPNTWLTGENTTQIAAMGNLKGQFNLIESQHVWLCRTQCDDNTPFQLFSGFDHGLRLENFELRAYPSGQGYDGSTQVPKLDFYRLPLMNSGPGAVFNVLGTGTAGNGSFTLSGFHNFYPESKIKFPGHSTVYTYTGRSGSTINVTPNLTASFTNENVLLGLPANNGIMVNGGENAHIANVNVANCTGAGIFVCTGTPSPRIESCMCNACDIAYWMDAGVNVLLAPSGDGSNVFLRSGYLGKTSTTMIGCKVEGGGKVNTGIGFQSTIPYPLASSNRAAIEFGGWTAAGVSSLVVHGGSFNMDVAILGTGALANDHAFITAFRDVLYPTIKLTGVNQLGYRNAFYKCFNVQTGALDVLLKRRKTDDYENDVSLGGESVLSQHDDTNFPQASGVKFVPLTTSINNSYGLFVDQGSGTLDQTLTYSRSGTTATFTYPTAHGIQVGDVILVRYPTGFTPADRLDPDTSSGNGYYSGAMIVKSVTTTEFTTTVLNSGGASGSGVRVTACRIFFMHGIRNGEHVLQMPTELGRTGTRSALAVEDKQGRMQAGLRVAVADEGQWWAKHSLRMGGTIDTPTVALLHGSGPPSASAPNGSLYLQTDGNASNTLHVRSGNAWWPLAAYQP